MYWYGYEVSANVSLLFTEVPYEDRFRAAADAGFNIVESWWPFAEPHPGEAKLDAFVELIENAGVRLSGLNFFAGNMPAGERGVACRAERAAELEAGTEALLRVAQATGCRAFNLLYGQLEGSVDERAQRRAATNAYRRAAEAVAEIDGVILVEPLADGLNGAYPLTTHHDALKFIEEVDADHLALLFDTFHLGRNGVDVPAAVREAGNLIGHVQLADSPGRGEPGSGALDWHAIGSTLREVGYKRTVAAEYKPTAETALSLGWLSPTR